MKQEKPSYHQIDTIRQLYCMYAYDQIIHRIPRDMRLYFYKNREEKSVVIDIDAIDREILTHYKRIQFFGAGEIKVEHNAVTTLESMPVQSMAMFIKVLRGQLKHKCKVEEILKSIRYYASILRVDASESPSDEQIRDYCEKQFKLIIHDPLVFNSPEALKECMYQLKRRANKKINKNAASMTRELLVELNIPVQSINQSINQSIIRK